MEDWIQLEATLVDWADFASGFGTSFMMIMATEIGDRTFFIAAIMAMKHPRLIVWSGAVAALALMTVLSAIFGAATVSILPPTLVNWVVILIMLYFGGTMVRDGLKMKSEGGFDELEEVEEEMMDDEEKAGGGEMRKGKGVSMRKVWIEAFTLTFLAEWGDRSQMATIALAAVYNMIGVIVGAVIGHALCTGGAVIGGRLIANYVSEKFVLISGGILFISFGIGGVLVEVLNLY